MGFWIFMLIANLLVPVSMIGFGSYFVKNAPREINMFFGYRTTMSMRNRETWEFAHYYGGKIWRVAGWILLVVSGTAMFFLLGKDEDIVGTYGGIISFLQLIPLVAPIVPTEIALKRNFDKRGVFIKDLRDAKRMNAALEKRKQAALLAEGDDEATIESVEEGFVQGQTLAQ